MGKVCDPLKKTFEPQKRRSLKHALAQRMGEQFPRLGGPRMLELCAELVMEVIEQHQRPAATLSHGQVLWAAISRDHPPARNHVARLEHLVPVVLSLSTPDDVQKRMDRLSVESRLTTRAVRLCQEAFSQGALLSNADLAELLNTHDCRIGQALSAYEDTHGEVVPRRATLHDVGTGVTHKRIICLKRYGEGKSPDQIARETYHSLEAVDRYLGMFDRVRHCLRQGMTPEHSAHILGCSLGLVHQYHEIDEELKCMGNS